jgi:hypothetical protein
MAGASSLGEFHFALGGSAGNSDFLANCIHIFLA